MTHLTLLESSGIVDFNGLPTAPPPSAATSQPPAATSQVLAATEDQLPRTTTTVGLLALGGGLAIGAFATKRILGNRRRPYRPRRDRYFGA
jgi:hypothetical protein